MPYQMPGTFLMVPVGTICCGGRIVVCGGGV